MRTTNWWNLLGASLSFQNWLSAFLALGHAVATYCWLPLGVPNRAWNTAPLGCAQVRERGVTPNGLMETPWPRWMARDPWATLSCSCCCFRGVPARHLRVGIDEQSLRRKTRGGRCPRGGSEGVSPSKGDSSYKGPHVPNIFSVAQYADMRA